MTPFDHPFDPDSPDAFDPDCPCARCRARTESARNPPPSLDDLPNHIRDLTVAIRDVQHGEPWPEAALDEAIDRWSIRDLLTLLNALEHFVLQGAMGALYFQLSDAWSRRDRDAAFRLVFGPIGHLNRAWARLTLLRERAMAHLDDD